VPGPELGSHLEIALAVASGITDAGLGVRAAATDLDLDFVSLTWEHYDIALAADALAAAPPLITALRAPSVGEAITALGGYDVTRAGTIESLTPS
jgi:molybdate-binding protein